MEKSRCFSSWHKVKVSHPEPCPGPKPFKALCPSSAKPGLRERLGDKAEGRREEGARALHALCDVTAQQEAARWKPWSAWHLAGAPSKFALPEPPAFPFH